MSWFEGLLALIGTILIMLLVAFLHALPFIVGVMIIYWLIF